MKAPSRIFFAAQPDSRVVSSLQDRFAREFQLLANEGLVPSKNLHQSLSNRCFDMSMRETYLRAGSLIHASAVTMRLNRVRSQGDHCAILSQGQPAGFRELLPAIQIAQREVGIIDVVGHTPHITISYRARSHVDSKQQIDPVEWTIKEVLLLEGGGDPYGYEILGCWPLEPAIEPVQMSLLT